jgi:beta-galactosidase
VFVYTSYPSAELFINGVSQGVRTFAQADGNVPCLGEDAMKRFRLMWNEVVYQPGELKVVAYDADGNPASEKVVCTAGKAAAIRLTPDRHILNADGEDLCYLNVSIVDKNGNLVPVDSRLINVKVTGAGKFKAIANGDPTCLESFAEPQMHLFNGQLTILVQSDCTPGTIEVEVSAKGVKKSIIHLTTM